MGNPKPSQPTTSPAVRKLENDLKAAIAMAQKFPNSAARAAMVAELTDELAAATPKHAVKTSDLHLAVENLEEQIAKANDEMHKKAAFIGKL